MPQQQDQNLAFFEGANSQHDFTVVLRGYERGQVDAHLGRLIAALNQSEQARGEAEQRMNDAQRRLRQAEQRLNTLEQKLADSNKLLEENSRPTLSGLGTRVEQILRLAEEQANDHRSEAKRESEGILSAGPPQARENTHQAGARAAPLKGH